MLILTLFVVSVIIPARVLADDGSGREEIIEISYTEYTWRLLDWQDKGQVCEVKIDHPGEPDGAEIYFQCGSVIYYRWLETLPCIAESGEPPQPCSGLYLVPIGSQEISKEIVINLPSPSVRIDLKDCIPVPDTDLCAEMPSLLISADEPLPNEEIIQVQGRIDERSFACAGEVCEVALQATDTGGAALEFWAESSYGDSSEHFMGRIRVDERTLDNPPASGWHVEVVSGLTDLDNMAGCPGFWQSFPPLGIQPDWLSNPSQAILLRTNEPYNYLAGQMIRKGYVDTSHCDDLGLSEEGYASPCGLEASRDLVYLWQNTFDRFILMSAEETGIPSSLFKRIFARESQFWPETTEDLYREYGFGHTTELGADTTMLWNREFFDQFCPLVLEVGKCQLGYPQLDDWSQATLRGALLVEMEIILPADFYDLDSKQVEESVSLFAQTLLGNCAQVGQMITYQTDQIPGEIVSYEDLWKFTLINYQAGSGCLADAIIVVHKRKEALTWEHISAALEENCPWAVEYIEDVTQ